MFTSGTTELVSPLAALTGVGWAERREAGLWKPEIPSD
jgi:hypothetical protein